MKNNGEREHAEKHHNETKGKNTEAGGNLKIEKWGQAENNNTMKNVKSENDIPRQA